MSHFPPTQRLLWLAAGLTVAVIALPACDGPGNSGQVGTDPAIVRGVPWQNGVSPALDGDKHAVVPDLAVYPPIGLGLPDPGPDRVDCRGLAGLEFSNGSNGWMDTFEPVDTDEIGLASGWSSYDDLTKFAFHTPGDATWYPGLNGRFGNAGAWGMPAEKTSGPSCDGKPNNWVLHFRGGLFRKWGGGISHAFTDPVERYRSSPFETCAHAADLCQKPLDKGATVDRAGLPVKNETNGGYAQSHDFFDVSAYEGIAFWARRGPEAQDRSLVILTDKYTSSRLARENQLNCRRVRECHTACLNGGLCSPDDPMSPTPTYRCFDPKQGDWATISANLAIDSQIDQMYPRCGRSACTSPPTYTDPDFDGEDICRPYSFPAADESGEYCWKPGAPPPPSRDERCQDGWQTSVQLTPDWKFYTLPFTQFSQVGFGKRAPKMDLTSLDTIAFGATMGWSDVYFDNITFYRRGAK